MSYSGRWLIALGTPKSLIDKANKMQLVTVDIRRLCEDLLGKNVDSIKKLTISEFFSFLI